MSMLGPEKPWPIQRGDEGSALFCKVNTKMRTRFRMTDARDLKLRRNRETVDSTKTGLKMILALMYVCHFSNEHPILDHVRVHLPP